MSVRILRMTREKDECFALLPRFTEAMRSFAHTYGQRGIETLCKRFEANFVLDGGDAAAWVAVDEDNGALRGHLLAFVELVFDRPVVYVQQLCITDSAAVTKSQREQVTLEFEQWARARGCSEIVAPTRVDHPRLWKRFGFERWHAVYRKTL